MLGVHQKELNRGGLKIGLIAKASLLFHRHARSAASQYTGKRLVSYSKQQGDRTNDNQNERDYCPGNQHERPKPPEDTSQSVEQQAK